ncbi:DUF2652 domain-containing protein [Spirosoma endophyticum]|nr:DUF2652 domain-containing protein [Spirosoma endophyticum]
MTTTELDHSSHAINLLIDEILTAVGDEYDVSEIEGDAVLLIKKGPAPAKKEILNICLKIFNAFHFRRMWIQRYTVCPCKACQSISNLTLKFVVHHGPLAEIKVGHFTKQSGLEMIVAHRLLKNDIENHEYLLITEKLLQQEADASETEDMEWTISSSEYDSIGKVDYRFTMLNGLRKLVPEPPAPSVFYRTDTTPYHEVKIAASVRDVYMTFVMNMANRAEWVPGLQKVEQDIPEVFIGSVHRFTFDDYEAIISPRRMTITEDGFIYAESCQITAMNLSLIYEYVFKEINEKTSCFRYRFMNASESTLTNDVNATLLERLGQMAEGFRKYCEGIVEFDL